MPLSKWEVNFYTDVSAHIVNPVMRYGTRGIGFKILQPAQVILISNIENVVGENIEIEDEFIFLVGKT